MIIEKKISIPKLHNNFHLKVLDSKSGELVKEAFAENIVLNAVYQVLTTATYGITNMLVGSGSGTPAVTDTGMFTYLTSKAISGKTTVNTPDLVTCTGKIVIGESELVGSTITEVGLYGDGASPTYKRLYTHAMLQDSEGNPISIGPKTNTQIIEIYFTIYIERGVGMQPFPNFFSESVLNNQSTFIGSTAPITIYPQGTSLGVAGSMNYTTKVFTSTPVSIASGTANTLITLGPATTDILALDIPIVNNAVVAFPNTAIFPVFSFSERVIGIGDGTKKWFPFPNGYFVEGSEVIKVDGVVKTAGVDYIRHQASRQPINISKVTLPYSCEAIVPAFYASNTSKTKGTLLGDATIDTSFGGRNQYSIVDFGKEILVSDFGISTWRYDSYNDNATNTTIQYSVDGVAWFSSQTVSMVYQYHFNNPEPISCRYIWIQVDGQRTLQKVYLYGLPSIEFLTAPANALEVKASWNTGVPPKNANLFYSAGYVLAFDW